MQLFLRLLLSVLLSMFLVSTVHAQTVDSNYIDGEIFVKLNDTSSVVLDVNHPAIATLVSVYGITDITRPFTGLGNVALNQTYKVQFSSINNVAQLINDIQLVPFVDFAERVPLYRVNYEPDDIDANQWHLDKVYARQAWDISQGNGNVVIAIIDNGVYLSHEDLQNNIWVNPGESNNLLDDDLNGYSDDINGYDVADGDNNPAPPPGAADTTAFSHGSYCAGIASSTTDNGVGIASIGFNCSIMAVKVALDNSNGKQLTAAYEGVTYAMRSDANVISMSFGSPSNSVTGQTLMNTAAQDGIVLIAAAGNDNTDTPQYPASYDNVISVAATNQNDEKSGFSNYGPTVDIAAPGEGIYSTKATGTSDYGLASGTSMAAPLVAGISGLLLSAEPQLTPAQVESRLKDNADPVNGSFGGQVGAGRVNAYLTLDPNGVISSVPEAKASMLVLYPNPAAEKLWIQDLSPQGQYYRITDLQGRPVLQGHYTHNAINISALAQGSYILQLQQADTAVRQLFLKR